MRRSCSDQGEGFFFHGLLDGVAVYHRALTQAEVQQTYQLGAAVAADLQGEVPEGGSYVITTDDLNFVDPDDAAADVNFTVSNHDQRDGEGRAGSAATSLPASSCWTGLVSFEHDGTGLTLSASFEVSVEDGDEDGSVPVPQTFNFTVTSVNHAPAVAGDLLATVAEGGTYQLTTADLDEADPDDSGTGLTYTVTSQTNGTVLVSGITASGFSAQDVIDGLVSFKHDGSETENASFAFSLADGGEDGVSPATGTFSFTVTPSNDQPANLALSSSSAPENVDGQRADVERDGQSGRWGWFDSLVLFGGGTFDLNSLAGFANFEEVRLVNISTNNAVLTLKDGTTSDVVTIGTGRTRSICPAPPARAAFWEATALIKLSSPAMPRRRPSTRQRR